MLEDPFNNERYDIACKKQSTGEDSMKAIFLARDGVINNLVYHQEQGIIDSPFTVEQLNLLPGVDEAIRDAASDSPCRVGCESSEQRREEACQAENRGIKSHSRLWEHRGSIGELAIASQLVGCSSSIIQGEATDEEMQCVPYKCNATCQTPEVSTHSPWFPGCSGDPGLWSVKHRGEFCIGQAQDL